MYLYLLGIFPTNGTTRAVRNKQCGWLTGRSMEWGTKNNNLHLPLKSALLSSGHMSCLRDRRRKSSIGADYNTSSSPPLRLPFTSHTRRWHSRPAWNNHDIILISPVKAVKAYYNVNGGEKGESQGSEGLGKIATALTATQVLLHREISSMSRGINLLSDTEL